MERVDRRNDKKIYQPKIHSERVRELYRIKETTGIPMTVLVDMAVREFIASYLINLGEGERSNELIDTNIDTFGADGKK